MRIAGIDQGTTSTRTLILGPNGDVEVIHSVEHGQYYPREGWVEHDPQELLQNIQACVEAAGQVDAVGIDNQGESCMAWDSETKEPLSPVIVWQDNRTIDEIERLQLDGHETTVLAKAGLPLDPYFSSSKLAWIVQNIPAAKRALSNGTLRLGTTDAFFLDHLTGSFVTDVTTASRTSLMNLAQQEWDEELCRIFQVPIECLPEIGATTGDFGAMKAEAGSIPVRASAVDQQAALYGFGCRKRGDAKITFGTGAFALTITGDEIVNRPELGLLPTIAWQKQGQKPVFALDGGVYTASAAVNWARSLGLFEQFSSINAFSGPPAIASGLVFVPALAGLGCPHWAPKARGAWLGLSLDHTPKQLVQSILEGVAFRAGEVIAAMNDCIPIKSPLYIDGGMSNNPYFVQFLANVLDREILAARVPELTGLGIIHLACDALDYTPEINSRFGSTRPNPDAKISLARFKQAIATSKNWVASATGI